MKHKDYVIESVLLGVFVSFMIDGSWPHTVALVVVSLAYISQEILAGQKLKTQTKELIDNLSLMEERFKAVELVAEDSKKHLQAYGVANGFKIGK